MRVHELAKELGIASKDLITDLKALGFEAKNHMSTLDPDAIQKIRSKFQKEARNASPAASSSVSAQDQPASAIPAEANVSKAVAMPSAVVEKEKRVLELTLPVLVKEFAGRLEISANQLIAKLIDLGEMLTLNDLMTDQDMVTLLATEFGFEVRFVQAEEKGEVLATPMHAEEEKLEKPLHLEPRSPVVTLMGHVDHGKTSLLDKIRQTAVAEHESGGITQHIGAYQVRFKQGKITFLDTPGHEAFTLMRARGAQVTDIVVLVVAADDGMMPQSYEALNHCKAAGVTVIVVLNKMDKPDVNAEKAKRQLSEKGMVVEDWGGQTIVCEVSAKTGAGIDHLLEMIQLQSEMMELKADPHQKGKGVVIESKLSGGKGPSATVLVRQGTFRVGDAVVSGAAYGRIKALASDQAKPVTEAGPSTPIEILGLSSVPEIGIEIKVVKSEKLAREMAELKAQEMKRNLDYQPKKLTLEDIFQKISNAAIKEFRLILKADVRGSLEALEACLAALKSDQVQLKAIHQGVGDVTENDVMLASASNALIIGFGVKASSAARDLAKKEGVEIRIYSLIYEIVDDVRKALEGLLEPIESQIVVGHGAISKVFELSKYGKVAGCQITDGRIARSSKVKLIRDGKSVFEGAIQSLKRFKDEVKEVREGFECGIRLEGFEDIQEGDKLEFFEIQKTAQKLS